jgi:hypothetical protein
MRLAVVVRLVPGRICRPGNFFTAIGLVAFVKTAEAAVSVGYGVFTIDSFASMLTTKMAIFGGVNLLWAFIKLAPI